MAKQGSKTNAMRMLDRAGVPYAVHTYGSDDGKIDGISVAAKVGLDPAGVYKTLVTRGASKGVFVFVIPVAAELDLKKAARAVGEKSIQMVHVDEIDPLTGYIRGGCSPVGMKKRYPTVFHRAVEELETVAVSGGRIGAQVEVDPKLLLSLVEASTADLIVSEGSDGMTK